jgi:hypothetical protein
MAPRLDVLRCILATGLLLLGGLGHPVGVAATYYVAPDGDDANPGSRAAPWATLRQAGRQARPGDTVKVKAGRYRQTNVVTACQGTPDRPIVFEADGGSVLLDGSVPLTGWRSEGGGRYSAPAGGRAIELVWAGGRLLLGPRYERPFDEFRTPKLTTTTLCRGQALLDGGRLYIRLFDDGDPGRVEMRAAAEHCLLLQATRHTVWRGIGTAWGTEGYKLEAGSAYNLITDAELHHHQQGILEIGATATAVACQHNTFRRLHVHHVGLTKFEHGIYTNGIRTRVLGCRFDHIAGAAVHAYPEPVQCEFDGNIATDPLPTYRPEHFTGDRPPEPTGHYTAFVCWGRGGHRVTNNLIAGPFATGISVRGSGNWFYNNTLVLRDGLGFGVASGSRDNCLVNNILQTAGLYVEGEAPEVLDHNAYHGGKGWGWGGHVFATLADLRAEGKEMHGLEAVPGFVDPQRGDYHLAVDSPLHGLGTTTGAPATDLEGVMRPQGKGVDPGSYEGPAAK